MGRLTKAIFILLSSATRQGRSAHEYQRPGSLGFTVEPCEPAARSEPSREQAGREHPGKRSSL
jgi:hypothetical protein